MSTARTATPVAPLLAITFVASLTTGVMWNGLAFVAKHDYGASEAHTFALYAVAGTLYTIAAFASGPIHRRLRHRLAPRSIVLACLAVQAVVSPLVLLDVGVWPLWVVAILVNTIAALQWTTIESYIGGGRAPAAMRSLIGWWNVAWMTATIAAMAMMAPLLEAGVARWAVAGLGPSMLVCIAIMLRMPARPESHADHDEGFADCARSRALLHTCRVMLPSAYVLMGAISPLLPFVLERLAIDARFGTLLAATWLVARVGVVVLMWRFAFWHGRWGTLLAAALLLAGGFAAVAIAPSRTVLLLGLVAFGLGQGITYYAAIWYALAVGRSEVDATGAHEGLIGAGYAIGPIAGLVALAFGGDDAIAWVVAGLLLVALLPGVRPYVRERRAQAG